MYSKAVIGGHPVHPMLVAFPIASYTGALVGFAIYAANGGQFWLNLAIALSIVGAGAAVLAALPGVADLAMGVPRASEARLVGSIHGSLNVIALGLFSAAAAEYFPNWNGPSADATLGLALSAAGVAVTVVAGALGWILVQTYHIGVQLTAAQQESERDVQQAPALTIVRHRQAG